MAAPDPDDFRMSLGDHLDELRSRLIKGLVGPFIFAVVLLIFGEEILQALLRPLMVALQAANLPPVAHTTEVGETFNTYIKIALLGGLVLGIPWLLYQIWKFVEPGLHFHERKFVMRLLPGSAFLTVVGLLFMYYILLPLTLLFLIKFSIGIPRTDINPTTFETWLFQASGMNDVASDPATLAARPMVDLPVVTLDPVKPLDGQAWLKMPENELRVFLQGKTRIITLGVASMMQPMFTLSNYISMVLWMGVAFAIAFQLPLVMLVVGWTGIITYDMLAGARRYALLICVIVAAILTPSGDPVSLAVMTAPLYGLYEVGLVLIRFFSGRRRAALADAENENIDGEDSNA